MKTAEKPQLNETFIEENLGLVHACCHRLQGRGIEYEELYGAGCLGLVKAARNFDDSRGLKFSTYAVPVILGEIRRLFRDGGSVRVSRSLKELSLKVSRERQRMSLSLGREPTVEELSSKLALTPEQVAEAICASRPVLSLTVGDDDDESKELQLPVESGEEEFCDLTSLRGALVTLPPQDRKLIELRYFRRLTQVKTAEILGMTQVQVSRRERVILNLLRAELMGTG